MTIKTRFKINKGDFSLDVDLDIPERGISALFGPSGSGKTTLLRAIAGLDRYQNGFLQVADMTWQDARSFTPPHKRPIGYVFQDDSMFTHLDIRQNLEFGLKRIPPKDRHISFQKVVALLKIERLLDRRPDHLSGGEKQRVAIARAVVVSPKLLLLDEPLAALDQTRKQEILPYIESLNQTLDIPVIYVSHATDEVARLAEHMILLGDGRVIANGDMNTILTRLDLPLANDNEAEALIKARVVEHDDLFNLTYLDFDGGRFTVPRQPVEIGQSVKLRIIARDVSLTLERQSGTSILNIFPAIIDEMVSKGPSQMTIKLMVSGSPMLSRVTCKSASLLGLKPGKEIFAQVKSVALMA